MPRYLLTCHPHTVGCTFGLDVCKTREVKGAHFALDHIQELLKIINYNDDLNLNNTHTMDSADSTCEPTIKGDIFREIPTGIYDLIIMPDCGGAFFKEQSAAAFASDAGMSTYHNNVFGGILEALIPGGYLVFSKMVYLGTDTQKNDYVAAMNVWFNKSRMSFQMRWIKTGKAGKACMSWFVIHKLLPNTTGGKSKARLKSKSRAKSKNRSKSKSRSKSKTRSKSKSRAKSKTGSKSKSRRHK